MTNQKNQSQKTGISASEFYKKVDVEFAYLTYTQYVKPDEAKQQAMYIVSQQFYISKE